MMTKPTDFAYYLTQYLSVYLPGVAGASKNTISSYKDTFKLFLSYMNSKHGKKPEKLTLDDIDIDIILEFLKWIEEERKCSVQTRNLRLTACHAFFRYIQLQDPCKLLKCQAIIGIPKKKHEQDVPTFLSLEGIEVLLRQPMPKTFTGMKHQLLLSFLYATACRVQEAVDVTIMDYKFNGNNLVRLTGKGNKSRLIPLETQVISLMDRYLEERYKIKPYSTNETIFINHSWNKITRQGISSILKKYTAMAREERRELIPNEFSAHSLRHSRAIHWLQAGVDLIYIRDLLGHTSVQTTERYARIDGEMKRKALEKASPYTYMDGIPEWQSDNSLMDWLKSF
ncbi:tyrosine-type recombinase/integrase [Enterococcus larvae]|uniref:tyrosine-type recombinase/integrase n=1 Tax=Enterococcus larvae TaxID=2794352 RepID=UPI003F3B6EDF